MIERFNFYDIYGYLLPGVLLIALLWMPLGLLLGIWPPADWGSAALAIALAYVSGHLLDNLSSAAFPPHFKDKQKRKRQPSDLLLDKHHDEVLPQRLWDLRDKVVAQIEREFGIDVAPTAEWTKNLKGRRGAAFFQCRKALLKKKAATYAEQQQGMYVLMRGCAAAFLLAAGLYAGIGIGAWRHWSSSWIGFMGSIALAILAAAFGLRLQRRPAAAPAVLATALALRFRDWSHERIFKRNPTPESILRKEKTLRQMVKEREPAPDERIPRCFVFWLLLIALAFAGFASARQMSGLRPVTFEIPSQLEASVKPGMDPVKFREFERTLNTLRLERQIRAETSNLMFALATTVVLLGLLCLSAYRGFAVNFAATIYRDYYHPTAQQAGIPTGNHQRGTPK